MDWLDPYLKESLHKFAGRRRPPKGLRKRILDAARQYQAGSLPGHFIPRRAFRSHMTLPSQESPRLPVFSWLHEYTGLGGSITMILL